MISLLLLVTIFLTFSTDSSGPPTLKLETHLVGVKFCAGENEVATYLMRLRLRYTDTSVAPIILYKGSNVVSTVMVSKSQADATARQHELSLPLTTYQTSGRPLSEKTRLDDRCPRFHTHSMTEEGVPIPFKVFGVTYQASARGSH